MMTHDFCLDGCMKWYDSVQDHVWLVVWVHPNILHNMYKFGFDEENIIDLRSYIL